MARFNRYHCLGDYYRQCIELDTAHDARHLLSVFQAMYPDLECDFYDGRIELLNICNRMHQPLTIKFKFLV